MPLWCISILSRPPSMPYATGRRAQAREFSCPDSLSVRLVRPAQALSESAARRALAFDSGMDANPSFPLVHSIETTFPSRTPCGG